MNRELVGVISPLRTALRGSGCRRTPSPSTNKWGKRPRPSGSLSGQMPPSFSSDLLPTAPSIRCPPRTFPPTSSARPACSYRWRSGPWPSERYRTGVSGSSRRATQHTASIPLYDTKAGLQSPPTRRPQQNTRPPPRSCRTPAPDKSAEAIDEWAPRGLLSVGRIGQGEGTAHRSIGGDCERSRGQTVVRMKDDTLEAPVRIAVGSRVPIQRSAVRRPPSKASSAYRWRSSGRAGPPRSFLESLPGAHCVPSIRSRRPGNSPLPSS